uniref:Putative secreted peptide n=1 Tax=Anopheles braziliensis TaxID=58242 RepID=A0A2M3ZS79_9DIPT
MLAVRWGHCALLLVSLFFLIWFEFLLPLPCSSHLGTMHIICVGLHLVNVPSILPLRKPALVLRQSKV